MGRQRSKHVKKKCTSLPDRRSDPHQNWNPRDNNSTLDNVRHKMCSNCCAPIDDSSTSKNRENPESSGQHEPVLTDSVDKVVNSREVEDPSYIPDLNQMLAHIYKLDFIPTLVKKYPDALPEETSTMQTRVMELPLCFLCSNLLNPLFSLYSQFNKIRKIESLLSKQIETLNFLINYDVQKNETVPSKPSKRGNRCDDRTEWSNSNSKARDKDKTNDPTTTTTATTTPTSSSGGGVSSSRPEIHSNDPEPCVWVAIEPLEDLTVEDVGYVPPSLRHLYQKAPQGKSTSGEKAKRRSSGCISKTTKLRSSVNERGPWVKIGPRLRGLTRKKKSGACHNLLTLPDPERCQEVPQGNAIIHDVFPVQPDQNNCGNNDNMNFEPSSFSTDANFIVYEPFPHPDFVKIENVEEAKTASAADMKPDLGLNSESTVNIVYEPRQKKSKSGYEKRRKKNKDCSNQSFPIIVKNETPKYGESGEERREIYKSNNDSGAYYPNLEDYQVMTNTKTMEKVKSNNRSQSIPVEKKYQCIECPFRTRLSGDLKRHILNVHCEEKVKCSHCDRKFKSKYYLTLHIRRMHTGREDAATFMLPCTVVNEEGLMCPFQTQSPLTLRQHLLTAHENGTVNCSQCGKIFRSELTLKYHIKNVHAEKIKKPEKKFSCSVVNEMGVVCRFRTEFQWNLRTHMITAHAEDKHKHTFKCRECPMDFPSAFALNEHVFYRHRERSGSVCPHCGIDFFTRRKCNIHRRTAHDDYFGVSKVIAVCQLCKKKCIGIDRLKSHMQTVHSDERPYPCVECGRSFKSKGNLQSHRSRTHTEEGRRKNNEYRRLRNRRNELIREQEARKAEAAAAAAVDIGADIGQRQATAPMFLLSSNILKGNQLP